jgi:hypothetical protein
VIDHPGDFVTLANGPTLPAAVVRLMFALEDRGFTFRLDGADALVVEPPDRLTADDIAAISRWRYHIAAVVRHIQPEVVQ